MDRSYIPIRRFYEKCLPAAQANRYRYVICLLARDTGVDDLYQTLKAQWVALDDVTGKDFLFLFAGKHIEDDGHSGITYQGTEGNPHQGKTRAARLPRRPVYYESRVIHLKLDNASVISTIVLG